MDMVASSVGEEGLHGVNGREGDARKEGEVTAGRINTRSVCWDQTAISERACARTSRCIKHASLVLLRVRECA